MKVRTVDVAGAGPLSVAEAGEGGRPLVLVHGFTGAKEDFTDWLDPLAALGWHVVAPDQRGHGDSPKPADEADYSFDHYVSDLLGLLDALGWSSAVALGHSMGGMVVQTALTKAADRFEAVVLMDTSHRTLRADPGVIDLAVELARNEGMASLLSAQTALSQGPGAAPAHLRTLATRPGYREFGDRKMLASAPAMYAAMLRAITDRAAGPDRLADLASVTVPALVVVGEEDTPFLKPSQRMADTIPRAQLVVIPDAAHSPQFENPDAWWATVSSFLDGL